ncbi:MAG: hypothetical protein WC343_11420 [Bacilli bacterium]|jgi:hypothetical protein
MNIILNGNGRDEVILKIDNILFIEKRRGSSYHIYCENNGDLGCFSTSVYNEITTKAKMISVPQRTKIWSAYANDKKALKTASVLDLVIESLNMVELDFCKDDWDIVGGYFNTVMLNSITTYDKNKPVLFNFNKRWLYQTDQYEIKGLDKFTERNIPVNYEPSLPVKKINVGGMFKYV